jgi:dGTPase
MISGMIYDLIRFSSENLTRKKINSLEKVRRERGMLIGFSENTRKEIDILRKFLKKNFYFQFEVQKQITRGKKIIKKLFLHYIGNPKSLPEPFLALIKNGEAPEIVVKDYIAGMTDHFAEETYGRLK